MATIPAPHLRKALEGAEEHPAETEPQTSGMTTAIVLSYVEKRGGRAAVERTLEVAGLLGRESELRDDSTWWTFVQKQALIHAAADVLDDPQVTMRAGEYALWSGLRFDRATKGEDVSVSGIDHVFFGHSEVDQPLTRGNCSWIDTGAAHSGRIAIIDADAWLAGRTEADANLSA